MTYDQTLVCEDAVNAEVLLRLARNELLESAQQTDRRVTALVDEEYVLPIVSSFKEISRRSLGGGILFDKLKTVIIMCRCVAGLTEPDCRPIIDLFDQVFYAACPAQCESQDENETVDPRKPVALSHVTNIPGLMRVVHRE